MRSVQVSEVVAYAQQRLQPERYQDYERALNGLQVENSGEVTHLAAAVDASRATVELALEVGADLLVVHHGLFWSSTVPWTGPRRALQRRLLAGNLAIYSQHLPLDGHPELGNAAGLARALSFQDLRPFFARDGAFIGIQTELAEPMERDELAARLAAVLGRPPILLPGGGPTCRRIGICTGGAGAELAQARAEGVDTFITGEGPHWTYALAEDLELNAFYGGHYATETFGVKALTAELAERFQLPWTFLDHPTGL